MATSIRHFIGLRHHLAFLDKEVSQNLLLLLDREERHLCPLLPVPSGSRQSQTPSIQCLTFFTHDTFLLSPFMLPLEILPRVEKTTEQRRNEGGLGGGGAERGTV